MPVENLLVMSFGDGEMMRTFTLTYIYLVSFFRLTKKKKKEKRNLHGKKTSLMTDFIVTIICES